MFVSCLYFATALLSFDPNTQPEMFDESRSQISPAALTDQCQEDVHSDISSDSRYIDSGNGNVIHLAGHGSEGRGHGGGRGGGRGGEKGGEHGRGGDRNGDRGPGDNGRNGDHGHDGGKGGGRGPGGNKDEGGRRGGNSGGGQSNDEGSGSDNTGPMSCEERPHDIRCWLPFLR